MSTLSLSSLQTRILISRTAISSSLSNDIKMSQRSPFSRRKTTRRQKRGHNNHSCLLRARCSTCCFSCLLHGSLKTDLWRNWGSQMSHSFNGGHLGVFNLTSEWEGLKSLDTGKEHSCAPHTGVGGWSSHLFFSLFSSPKRPGMGCNDFGNFELKEENHCCVFCFF